MGHTEIIFNFCKKFINAIEFFQLIKATKAVNWGGGVSYPKLMYMNNKHYKHVLGRPFRLERNKYCSTFTINIESSLIHS